MKYCQQCGAQIPDEANFCRSCGAKAAPKVSAHTSDDGEGIVIDAPEEATVIISGETKAPDEGGEFSVANWGERITSQPPKPKAPKMQEPPKVQESPKVQEPPKVQEAPRVEKPVEPEPVEPKKKSVGIFSIIWTFIKVMIIVLSLVFSAVIIKGFFKSTPPEAPKEEQTVQPTSSQVDLEIPGRFTGNESETNNNTVHQSEDDEIVFEKNDDEDNSGFQKIEDMPLPERAEYYEGLLERTEQYLQQELAKGADANQNEIRQLRKDIDMLRERLSQFKQ